MLEHASSPPEAKQGNALISGVLNLPAVESPGAKSFSAPVQRALWVAAVGLPLFISVVIWRPFGSNGDVHNLVVLACLVATSIALATASLAVRTGRDWALLGGHALIAGFLVRSIPVVLLPYPPLHDGYYYFVSAINVAEEGSLSPVLANWYSQVGQQLHWPLLQLLTTQLSSWSGTPLVELWRFLPPALGSLTFVAVSLVTYAAFEDWRIASVAGLLATFSDIVLFYQMEYQPQGLAITLFTFFVYTVLLSRSSSAPGVRLIALIVGAAFLFTHHASTLALAALLLPVLFLTLAARLVLSYGLSERLPRLIRVSGGIVTSATSQLMPFLSIAVLLVVASISLHVYYSTEIFRAALAELDPSTWFSASTGSGPQPTALVYLLRLGKFLLFPLALVGVVATVRLHRPSSYLLAVLFASLSLGALASSIIVPGAGSRLLALWFPFAAVFAAYALTLVARSSISSRTVVVLAIATYCAIGVIDAQLPALPYLFQGVARSEGAWFGNALPRTDRTALAGTWLVNHAEKHSTFAVDFSTRMAPFYFGRIPDSQVIYNPAEAEGYCAADYLVVDYGLSTGGFMHPSIDINYSLYPRVYDNGSVAILRRDPATACEPMRNADEASSAAISQVGPSAEAQPALTSAAALALAMGVAVYLLLGLSAFTTLAARAHTDAVVTTAASVLLGICLAGLALLPFGWLGPDRDLFQRTTRWFVPTITATIAFLVLFLRMRRRRLANAALSDSTSLTRGAVQGKAWSRLPIAGVLLSMIWGAVLITARPSPQDNVELFGTQADGRLEVTLVVHSDTSSVFSLVVAAGSRGSPRTLHLTASRLSGPVTTTLDAPGDLRVDLYRGDHGPSGLPVARIHFRTARNTSPLP
jgi:hypothetical protein